MALEPARLADFQVNQSIGTGSTAKVFDAVHLATGKRVALKTLEQEAEESAELRERLAREAFILAGVESKHVGRILGFGYDKDLPFLVLERLHGETLDALIKREGQLNTRQIVHWVEQLLVGVRDCHAAGIVHRDIKPSNVFLQDEGNGVRIVKLIDFGVARLREVTHASGAGLTQTNHLLGSMGYMAPEQFLDPKNAGSQADLYAVGVVVFRVIAGRLPFVHRSLEAVIKMKCEGNPPLLSSMPNVVSIAALDQFCVRALARDPQHRFLSAREMLDEWWNVVTYIDEEAPLTLDSNALDVVFDDEPVPEDPLLRTLTDVLSASVSLSSSSSSGSHPAATQREPNANANANANLDGSHSSSRTMPDTMRPPHPTLVDEVPPHEGSTTAPGTHSVRRLLKEEDELALQRRPPTKRGS